MNVRRDTDSRLRRTRLLGASVACVLGLALAPAHAGGALPSSTPDPSAFQANGQVLSIARGGGRTFIGGTFTELSARVGPGVRFGQMSGIRVAPVAEVTGGISSIAGEPRAAIAKLYGPTGNAFSAWDPGADNVVNALAVNGTDVYAGGGFTNIGGMARNSIAKLYAPSGNVFSQFDPGANFPVRALAADGSGLYTGGDFTQVGGRPRQGFARFPSP